MYPFELPDSLTSVGNVVVIGSTSLSEVADEFSSTTNVIVQGTFGLSEESDAVAVIGNVIVQGAVNVTEVGDDKLPSYVSNGYVQSGYFGNQITGSVLVQGLFTSSEDSDTFEASSLAPTSYYIKLRGIKFTPADQVIILPKESRNIKLFAL